MKLQLFGLPLVPMTSEAKLKISLLGQIALKKASQLRMISRIDEHNSPHLGFARA